MKDDPAKKLILSLKVTDAPHTHTTDTFHPFRQQSDDEKIKLVAEIAERTFFRAIDKFTCHKNDAYACLALTLMAYEKHLRCLRDCFDERIKKDSPFFDQIRIDLELDSCEDAQDFWTVLRHGIFHRAFPNTSKKTNRYFLRNTAPLTVSFERNETGKRTLFVNPFWLKGHLLPKMRENVAEWVKDPKNLIPTTSMD